MAASRDARSLDEATRDLTESGRDYLLTFLEAHFSPFDRYRDVEWSADDLGRLRVEVARQAEREKDSLLGRVLAELRRDGLPSWADGMLAEREAAHQPLRALRALLTLIDGALLAGAGLRFWAD